MSPLWEVSPLSVAMLGVCSGSPSSYESSAGSRAWERGEVGGERGGEGGGSSVVVFTVYDGAV